MSTGGIKLFKEGQLLQHKQRFTIVRLTGIIVSEVKSIRDESYEAFFSKKRKRKRYHYIYVLRSLDGQHVKVMRGACLSRYWNVLVDPSVLTSDNVQELKRQLEVAKSKEKYELCAMLRDRIAVLNGTA